MGKRRQGETRLARPRFFSLSIPETSLGSKLFAQAMNRTVTRQFRAGYLRLEVERVVPTRCGETVSGYAPD